MMSMLHQIYIRKALFSIKHQKGFWARTFPSFLRDPGVGPMYANSREKRVSVPCLGTSGHMFAWCGGRGATHASRHEGNTGNSLNNRSLCINFRSYYLRCTVIMRNTIRSAYDNGLRRSHVSATATWTSLSAYYFKINGNAGNSLSCGIVNMRPCEQKHW